jgi:hypothetical protein
MGREPWTSRLTVEECPIHLSTAELYSSGAIRLPDAASGTVSLPLSDGSSLGKLHIEVRDDWRGLCLVARWRVPPVGGSLKIGDGQTIRLTTTQPHFGGKRFWFVCGCGRRAGRLCLPTEQIMFRCRLCYDLTYASAQEHNTRAESERELIEYCRELMAGS